jgi:hypothetical protein
MHLVEESNVIHIPVRVGEKTVTVWVATDHCRYFTHHEVPEWLKQRLTMIMSCDNKYLTTRDAMDYSIAPNGIVMRSAYEDSKRECPEGFEDIGWRVNDKYYYVVADTQTVDELKIGAEVIRERLRP